MALLSPRRRTWIKKAATALVMTLVPLPSFAELPPGVTVTVEPIIGYERVQKVVPTVHSKDRLMYGARVSAGIPMVSAEGEYTRGTDTEDFLSPAQTIKDTDDRLKLGITSQAELSKIAFLRGRGGVQAKRTSHEVTVGGSTTRTMTDVVYDPYLGFALGGSVAKNLTLTGGLTVIFNEFPKMNRNEYQTTLGFSVSVP